MMVDVNVSVGRKGTGRLSRRESTARIRYYICMDMKTEVVRILSLLCCCFGGVRGHYSVRRAFAWGDVRLVRAAESYL